MKTTSTAPAGRFEVLLYHNAVPVARCSGEWIGTGRMWVAGGPIRYPRNTKLEVEILSHGTFRRERLTAVVSGESGRGFKLSLVENGEREPQEHGGGTVREAGDAAVG